MVSVRNLFIFIVKYATSSPPFMSPILVAGPKAWVNASEEKEKINGYFVYNYCN